MTHEEAIKRLETHIMYHRSGAWSFTKTDEAMEMAISALREQPRWISVANRLPEEWKTENGDLINYMVFMPEYGVDIGNYLKPAKTWVCVGIQCDVSHWMPLPKAPTEEEV